MIKLWKLSLTAGIVAVTFAVLALPREIPPVDPAAVLSFEPSIIGKGEILATAGNCVSCHTAEGGQRLAGGRMLWTPFGGIASRNITPDVPTGIGGWSKAAFVRAMREGVARDGSQLFPACPFDHFTKLTEDDLAAIYSYLMSSPAVRATPPANIESFPLGIRPLQAISKLLYLRPGPYRIDASRSEDWNRGAYIVEGLAACGACHTPRGALGAEQAGHPFAGERIYPWLASALDLSPSPMRWTRADLHAYLGGGSSPQGRVAGPMAEVAANLRKLPPADVDAVATYFLSINRPSSANPEGDIAHALAYATRDADPAHAHGRQIYTRHCAACHEAATASAPAGQNADLSLRTALWDREPLNFISIVLSGVGPSPARSSTMPAFGDILSEDDLIAVASYLRHARTTRPPWPMLPEVARLLRASLLLAPSR